MSLFLHLSILCPMNRNKDKTVSFSFHHIIYIKGLVAVLTVKPGLAPLITAEDRQAAIRTGHSSTFTGLTSSRIFFAQDMNDL